MSFRIARAALLLCLFLIVFSFFAASRDNPDLKSLYDAHHWFALRDAVEHRKVSHFYRGAVAAIFNQRKPAQENLEAVIREAPHSKEAHQAHDLLANLYLRTGRFRDALEQVNATLAEDPGNEDAKNAQPMLSVLSQSPDQVVVQRGLATVQMLAEDGNLYLPVTINGSRADYPFDTGANISVLSESEAKRFGLAVRSVDAKLGSITSAKTDIRVAVARTVVLGEIQLANVAFLVLPDEQPPFSEMPEGKRGLIGIPVFLSLQTVSWSREGVFRAGFSSGRADMRRANVCFEGSNPVTQAFFQNKPLEFALDTGATTTDLYPAFARDFADLVHNFGKKESHTVNGVAGSANVDSIVLPSLNFQVGGHELLLKPAHVGLEKTNDESAWFFGNLGMDLLSQAHTVTLDFRAMRLTLE